MIYSFVAVLDSGIGGISVLNELIKNIPSEKYIYYGDNKNAPYGNKSIEEMWALTRRNLDQIFIYPIKCLVVACNTLSVNLIDKITKYVKVPVFGVFPPVGECGGNEKTLLLSTIKTSKLFKGKENLHVLGLKDLVSDIENNLFNLNIIDIKENLQKSEGDFMNRKGYYDTVILGCTHYSFVKNKIIDHFCPKKVISGNTFTVQNVKNFLCSDKSVVNYNRFDVNFIGENAIINRRFFVNSGQNY